MNFIEAWNEMSKGKTCKCLYWEDRSTATIINDDLYLSGTKWKDGLHTKWINSDWEVVDTDQDWNLVESLNDGRYQKIYTNIDIKKCRDLIIEAVNKCFHEGLLTNSNLFEVINKRFGDL